MGDSSREVPELEIGSLYGGRYRVLAPIGRGGMGRVYLAEDVRLGGRRRALKVTASPRDQEEAFFREARLLSELHHPQLPDIVDYVPPDPDGWAVIVMEYIAGESLGDRFARNGNRMPFAKVSRYFGQLCELLVYLHGRQPPIVFRDLKPSNVLVDPQDRAVLVDFGIARPYRPEAAADTERLGTPAFAAPEQLGGEQTDARSDLYSLCALAYYLLSGGQAAIRRTSGGGNRLPPDVPPYFRELLEWGLAEHPADRPQSAAALLERLQTAERTLAAPPRIGIAEGTPLPGLQEEGVTVVAVMSAYPGAGATLAAMGLSRYLNACRIPHALVEWPAGEPELHGLMNGSGSMPKFAVWADPSGQGGAVPAWQEGCARYYPAKLEAEAETMPAMPGFAAWLRRLGAPIVVIDASSRWELPGMTERLAVCGIRSVWWVADCQPAKWSDRRQAAAADFRRQTEACGTRHHWIANRDHRFSGRGEWLACLPAAPAVKLPLLPAEDVIRAVWRGEGFPADRLRDETIRRAFRSWAGALGPVSAAGRLI
ncbi:serine/threonine protein kinase [Cohnella caldifontis]|uniref:serine/threonine protein kinase n=1 Tax=Cohnella caldifontis TaxID=3027471 RepID=UPI0023ECB776|nr:serine/threonine-protein kinase [Cohnella sp. YIM B05605]